MGKNFQEKLPAQSVKSFSYVYFHRNVSTKRLFVNNINHFRSKIVVILDASTLDETFLLIRDNLGEHQS